MINIVKAERLLYFDPAYVYAKDYEGDRPMNGIVCVPYTGTVQQVNYDYFRQGESYGDDNEVVHRKYTGDLISPAVVSYQGKEYPAVYSYSMYMTYINHKPHYKRVYTVGMKKFTVEDFYDEASLYPGKPNWSWTNSKWEGGFTFSYDYTWWSYKGDGSLYPGYPKTERRTITLSEVTVVQTSPIKKDVISSLIGKRPKIEDYDKPHLDVWSALYAEACNGVFPLDTNNVANAKDIASTMITLVKAVKAVASKGKSLSKFFDPDSITSALKKDCLPTLRKHVNPKKASEAWLAYRYAYLTTKSDIAEHQKHLASAWDVYQNWSNDNSFDMHSVATDGDTVYRMRVTLQPKMKTEMQELWVKSAALGLQINAVNTWDLVPFSFIVDWFLPIEETLQALDNSCLFNKTHFDISMPLVSTKTERQVETPYGMITETDYNRWMLSSRPVFLPAEKHDPSTRTSIYRFVDGVSLIVGSR